MTELIRYHDAASAAEYLPLVRHAFREAEDPRARLVAWDWLGRQYVQIGDDVFRADLGYGDWQELVTRAEWDAAIRDYPADVLDGPLYEAYRTQSGLIPDGLAPTDVVEYTRPLYLGGAQNPANMAVIDVNVHWVIGSQVRNQTRDLPPGAGIGEIRIDPPA